MGKRNSITKMIALYKKAKESIVGSIHKCPSCSQTVNKTTYNKVFCSNARTKKRKNCKDLFWNRVDPEKRCRKTPYFYNVILEKEAQKRGFPTYEDMVDTELNHDPSWDAHGNVEVAICDICRLRSDYCQCGEGVF